MKIIEVMPEFGLAGAEIMCENLSTEFKNQGIETVVVSLYDYHSPITERLENKGIRVFYLNKKPGLDLSMIPKLIRLFFNEKPDAVHTHRYVMQYVIPSAIIAGIGKRFHTVHNIAIKETTRNAQKLNYLFYHLCHVTPVALSEEIQKTISVRYKINSQNIPVVFNGIPLEKCIPKSDYRAGETFQYLHIGRFSKQKQHTVFLNSFKNVLEHGKKVHLTLVGTGELENEVRKKVHELKLEEHVTFYGTTDNVYPLLHEADAFILPSAYEGMPMTLIEAMGTALPILATEVGGIPSMLENGTNAILTAIDEASITRGMLLLLDEDLRKTIGPNAFTRAEAEFSSKRMADRYAALFRN